MPYRSKQIAVPGLSGGTVATGFLSGVLNRFTQLYDVGQQRKFEMQRLEQSQAPQRAQLQFYEEREATRQSERGEDIKRERERQLEVDALKLLVKQIEAEGKRVTAGPKAPKAMSLKDARLEVNRMFPANGNIPLATSERAWLEQWMVENQNASPYQGYLEMRTQGYARDLTNLPQVGPLLNAADFLAKSTTGEDANMAFQMARLPMIFNPGQSLTGEDIVKKFVEMTEGKAAEGHLHGLGVALKQLFVEEVPIEEVERPEQGRGMLSDLGRGITAIAEMPSALISGKELTPEQKAIFSKESVQKALQLMTGGR
jgi:hypothetical protein